MSHEAIKLADSSFPYRCAKTTKDDDGYISERTVNNDDTNYSLPLKKRNVENAVSIEGMLLFLTDIFVNEILEIIKKYFISNVNLFMFFFYQKMRKSRTATVPVSIGKYICFALKDECLHVFLNV